MTDVRIAPRRLGIVLVQLGGPASIEDVQPFLENMFRDPDLFDLPIPDRLRNWLAWKLSSWRAAKAKPLYRSIGGKSPIIDTTHRQAALLERALTVALPCRVFVAMRYGSPSTASTVEAVHEADLDRLLILPLYPQYSSATTGSSTKEWDRLCREKGLAIPTDRVDSYCSFPAYIDALVDRVDEGLGRFSAEFEASHCLQCPRTAGQAGQERRPLPASNRRDHPTGNGPMPAELTAHALLPEQDWSGAMAPAKPD